MKLSNPRTITTLAIIALACVIAVLIFTAPKNPRAIFRVVDASGKPIAGAVIHPQGLRVKPGPYNDGWYGWSEKYQHVPNLPVTTDKDGFATIPYPFYVHEKLETGTLCLFVEHPDFVPQDPERVVATALPHGTPWHSRLEDLFNRIRHRVIETRPAPIVLENGATLHITITNAPPAGSGEFFTDVSAFYLPSDSWSEPAHGELLSHQIPKGSHTVRVSFIQTNGTVLFSDVADFTAEPNQTNHLTLSLKPGFTIHGELDKTVARPVKHGRVIAHIWPAGTNPNDEPPQWHAWTNINEDGTFSIPSMPSGDLEIAAICDGFISTNGAGKFIPQMRYPQKHQINTGDLTVKIGMEPTATLEVTIKDDKGTAVTNATAVTSPNLRWGDWGAVIFGSDCYNTGDRIHRDRTGMWAETRHDFSATTDANGVAIISNLPPTTDTLDVQHPSLALPLWAPPNNGGRKTRVVMLKLTTPETNRLSLKMVPKEQSVMAHY